MLAPTTFPSRIEYEKMPKGYYGRNFPVKEGVNKYIRLTPFHEEKMEDAKKRVMDVERINNINEKNYLVGFYRNKRPKPEPQGSFQRPLQYSGEVGYGESAINNSSFQSREGQGLSGGFRTREGQKYGQSLLRKRAEELEQIEALKETGMPISIPPKQPLPVDQENKDLTSFALILDDLVTILSTGDYKRMSEIDLNKMYNLLKSIVLDLDLQTSQLFLAAIDNQISIMLVYLGSEETPQKYKKFFERIVKRLEIMRGLLELSISSINSPEKNRQKIINQYNQRVTKIPLQTTDARKVNIKLEKELEALKKQITKQRARLEEVGDDMPPFIAQEEEAEQNIFDTAESRYDKLYNTNPSGTTLQINEGINPQRFQPISEISTEMTAPSTPIVNRELLISRLNNLTRNELNLVMRNIGIENPTSFTNKFLKINKILETSLDENELLNEVDQIISKR